MLSSGSVSPGKTLTERVRQKLSEILESSDLIKFVGLVTMDGFTIASNLKDDNNIDPKLLGALIVSSIKNLETNLRKVLENASLSEIVISIGQDLLIAKSIGKLALIMIVDKTLDINFIMYSVEEGLNDLITDLGLERR
ncbi:hypothetical protein [Vulcanisaeta souniana]|uniref:Roadblock/LAMTOR2 domain-containing protein n=1 Tax=Vulcanisaeta souniana JCM 11219 TaxID=1293586 RepID=A0A830EHM2_9CREN|nr:hypothetical protein [Vulcanisaeta souniana]BDR91342.1 hypothetical protein Vsou_04350 [Vulcanisaeta souniana JCM 11219]GGI72477.1 hypothetical protein GCM10007112_06570 [Vulcanisaeta souniana JCM 11219]